MTDFSDTKALVQAITNRPDLAALEANKINAAVRMISLSGKYWRDLQEITLGAAEGVSPTAYIQSLAIPSRLRHTVYLAYPDAANNPTISSKDITEIITKEGAALTDLYYMSGALLHIRHSVLTPTFLMGYYEYPVALVADGDTNWILELMPELVADLAASLALNAIGNKDNATLVNTIAGGELSILVADTLDKHNLSISNGR